MMMSVVLNEYIRRENVRLQLEWRIKENAALNTIHEFFSTTNIDESLKELIRLNHQYYRFLYSMCVNMIYMSVYEMPIQEQYWEAFNNWQTVAKGGWIRQSMLQFPPLPQNTVADTKSDRGGNSMRTYGQRK